MIRNHLTLIIQGKPSSMALKESILQMKGLIIPVIMKELEVFRLPRIEGTTAK
jgi:hypothetical protein